MKTLQSLFTTNNAYGPMLTRIALGIVLLAHGLQITMGWFGGSGFTNMMIYLTSTVGLPLIVALMVVLLQSFGALLLIAGIFTRVIAFGVAVMFIGMIVTSHLDHGFFMNWFGNQSGEGYEYHILIIALCVGLITEGAGRFSLDRHLFQHREK